MKLELIPFSDPILHQKTQPFDFENPPHDPAELAEAMNALVEEKNGLGLACPQVGIPFAMFVMRGPIACFNPRIIGLSKEMVMLEEACLSWPGLICKIKRSKHVRVRFQNEKGETFTETYTGVTARCVIHESEHLEGKTFINSASKYHKDLALRQWRKRGGDASFYYAACSILPETV